MDPESMLERLDRVESRLAIQELAVRHALAIDARDIDAWLLLFVEDVDCGRRGKGREALRGFIEPAIRTFYRSVHLVCGHAIDFVDADNATGRVYTRAEHEVGDRWIIQACCYFDTYARRNGQWGFVRRDEDFYYSADVLERPQEIDFQRWPGPAPKHAPPMMAGRFPSWNAFWADCGADDLAAITRHPAG